MECQEILALAKCELEAMRNRSIDVIDVKRPPNIEYAKQLAKVVSKLSPLVGNMIEYSVVDLLNARSWNGLGKWIKQDPGFPDAVFQSKLVLPNPGIEIKAWFPLATEITARFKDSVKSFMDNNIDMALIAWLPESIIWGRPKIIDVLVTSGRSVAEARDSHYHNPPDYIIFEPEDTKARTANLRQSNTMGYKFQNDKSSIEEALEVVSSWGEEGRLYSTSPAYQRLLREIQSKFVYRLDTNYAKIDRINHKEIEEFKSKVLGKKMKHMKIHEWCSILSSKRDTVLKGALNKVI